MKLIGAVTGFIILHQVCVCMCVCMCTYIRSVSDILIGRPPDGILWSLWKNLKEFWVIQITSLTLWTLSCSRLFKFFFFFFFFFTEFPWCWERLKAGGEGDDRGWDGWMASPAQWRQVWVNSRSWWWTGRPGVLQSMGLQRVRHD